MKPSDLFEIKNLALYKIFFEETTKKETTPDWEEEFEEMRTTSYEKPIVISDDEADSIKEFIIEKDKDIIKKAEEGLELHTHNSIPCYTGEEDEGCDSCVKNKAFEKLITKLKGEL